MFGFNPKQNGLINERKSCEKPDCLKKCVFLLNYSLDYRKNELPNEE